MLGSVVFAATLRRSARTTVFKGTARARSEPHTSALGRRLLLAVDEGSSRREAATGEVDESQADMQSIRAHIDDVTESERRQVAEALRPFYTD